MTESKNIDLTPEEQAEIAQNAPKLFEALESGSAISQAWLASWRRERTMSEEAKRQAAIIRQEIIIASSGQENVTEQGTAATWCGYPTDMTRCSPFFPMRNNELGHREFLQNYVITSANWGEILYTGPKLSTYEEDILLALLATVEQKSQQVKHSYFLDYGDGVEVFDEPQPNHALPKTLTYKGPALPLLQFLGYSRPNKKDYARLIAGLERLTVSAVKIAISAGKTKSGNKRAPRMTQMSALLAGVRWDAIKKELTATINPFFYETYIAGRVTLMDVAKRMQLKGSIAKALYRFVQSHRNQMVFEGHFLTLASALNMVIEQPTWEIRRQLKAAMTELIRQNILAEKSCFVNQNIIQLTRNSEALPVQNIRKGPR